MLSSILIKNDEIKLALEEKDNKIICSIKDSGIGIKVT